jgi:hypothetical protein
MDNWMEHLKDKTFRSKVEELLDEAFIINYKSGDHVVDNTPRLEEMAE